MKRKITGFHQDEKQDWVADLECGHGRHVRHTPPWMNHPWVVTPEGRAQWIGAELECMACALLPKWQGSDIPAKIEASP
jgi:hypothetical protein